MSEKKIQSSGVPIGLLTKKIFFYNTIRNIMDDLLSSFEPFLITNTSGRSDLVTFSPKKILTSNGCKPIGVLSAQFSFDARKGMPIAYNSRDL